jgi:pimeloyl-ACP methyl ester carboxylesterase
MLGDTQPPPAGQPEAFGGRIARFPAQDGTRLAARIYEASRSERLPLLCLAGLSRNSRDFAALGRFFSNHPTQPRTVVALDYRGRGLSDFSPDWRSYTPMVEAHDVLAATAALGLPEVILVGTSRGGLIAMLLCALRPTVLAGVVLNDIGPVIEGEGLARIKTYLSAQSRPASWDEAIAQIRRVHGPYFPALAEQDWQAFAEAIYVETPGGLRPDFDPQLTKTLEGMDFTDKIPALWQQFAGLGRVPVLAIRGELSDLLSPDTFAEMAKRHPDLEQIKVPGQGHAPLLRDAATLGRILAFADRCRRPARS